MSFLYFNINYLMQNPLPKFKESSIISEKQGYLSEKLKTLTSSNYHRFNNFYGNFAHISNLIMSTKECLRFFVNLFRCENVKNLVSMNVYKPRLFQFFQIAQDLNQNTSNTQTSAKCQQKYSHLW